jgi:hypothetical protein
MGELVIVCCHAICLPDCDPYEESSWLLKPFQRSNPSTGKPGEHETFLLHIQAGVNALRRKGATLVLSGAKTDHNVLMQCFGDSDFVRQAIARGRIMCENAATDSYQNLLFSLIQYYEILGKWPQMITIITHAFKENRFLVRVKRTKLLDLNADKSRMPTRLHWDYPRTGYACKASILPFLCRSCEMYND